jgi:uncharacterized protein YndB with AHSA1/START domain
MNATRESDPTPMKNRTTVERKSERELIVTRTINGPARIVFEAFTRPELLRRWWVPKSFGVSLLSCEADVCVGGEYRFVFGFGDSKPVAFFGRYLEVTPHSRLVWTNDEGEDGGAVTTVTFEERGGKTLLVMHDLYPSKEALDAAMASGEKRWARRSSNWTSFSSPLARVWDRDEVVDLAVGHLAGARGSAATDAPVRCNGGFRVERRNLPVTPITAITLCDNAVAA